MPTSTFYSDNPTPEHVRNVQAILSQAEKAVADAKSTATEAASQANAAKTSANNALTSAQNAALAKAGVDTSANNAASSATSADNSRTLAQQAAQAVDATAKTVLDNATKAAQSATAAAQSATTADGIRAATDVLKTAAQAAKTAAEAARDQAQLVSGPVVYSGTQNLTAAEARLARNNIKSLGWASAYVAGQTRSLTVDDVGSFLYGDGPATFVLPLDSTCRHGDEFELFVSTNTVTVTKNASSSTGIGIQGVDVSSVALPPGYYRIKMFGAKWMLTGYSRPQDSYPSVGDIVLTIGSVAPPGTLKLNGALLSRTTYADLWAFAVSKAPVVTEADFNATWSGAFTTGDGSTNFRIPDFRGEFPRFWDDSRGLDTSRTSLGQRQAQATPDHYHESLIGSDGSNIYAWTNGNAYGGRVIGGVTRGRVGIINEANTSTALSYTSRVMSYDGGEVRPRNINALACIRYK